MGAVEETKNIGMQRPTSAVMRMPISGIKMKSMFVQVGWKKDIVEMGIHVMPISEHVVVEGLRCGVWQGDHSRRHRLRCPEQDVLPEIMSGNLKKRASLLLLLLEA